MKIILLILFRGILGSLMVFSSFTLIYLFFYKGVIPLFKHFEFNPYESWLNALYSFVGIGSGFLLILIPITILTMNILKWFFSLINVGIEYDGKVLSNAYKDYNQLLNKFL